MKLTNEKRQALIERCKKHLEWHEKLGFRGEAEEELASINRITLAALTAEPVAFTTQRNINGFSGGVSYMWPPGNEKPTDVALYVNPTYNTAPAVKVPDEKPVGYDMKLCDAVENFGWNSCRAEVLRLNAEDSGNDNI